MKSKLKDIYIYINEDIRSINPPKIEIEGTLQGRLILNHHTYTTQAKTQLGKCRKICNSVNKKST